ncbi:uncharacterized protein V1518DRAFT_438462 [Limtongia smithiae]|uniref:uncharacterized protein n=1 Tax=Limtongia smithiae TaxID=1125753 RepID=UPI0034CFFB08
MQSPVDAFTFSPFRSFVDPSFFEVLARKKLKEYKLDVIDQPLCATYVIPVSQALSGSSILSLDSSSFIDGSPSATDFVSPGVLRNVNTIEEFKAFDKSSLMKSLGRELLDDIKSGVIDENPSTLAAFYVITFSDLKKFKFTYWFAFPSIITDWTLESSPTASTVVNLVDSKAITIAFEEWRKSVPLEQHGFFLLKKTESDKWTFGSLSQFDTFLDFSQGADTAMVGFADPSSQGSIPGWPLRNFLVYLSHKGLHSVKVLCLRDLVTLPAESRSIWLTFTRLRDESEDSIDAIKTVGWERSKKNKLMPKVSDLSGLMDPRRLADQAVDLNLQLMKWRLAPELDLDKVKNTKCLLLGAGTLGTYVARALMGWGVKNITFVDNATVSYSNPVRQPLYTLQDCISGTTVKSVRAAEALREIYPGVQSSGFAISVPMAGHPVTNEQREHGEYDQLVKLIDEHDAVFLLLDSREARWLPSVIAAAKEKIVINAALGFDSYVVMRHGVPRAGTGRLGCYFCNDIYAPSDSLADRTLDQMCTVTRPGIALLASGLAVELFVSILQHPLGAAAPAPRSDDANLKSLEDPTGDNCHSPLGDVPHQMRGFLHRFDHRNFVGACADYCSACSDRIIQEWKKRGWDFVKNALNVPGYVDDVSGLTDMRSKADELADDDAWAFDDESELDLME